MAQRAAAPSPANQAGRSAAKAIKKIPKAILWITMVFALIGGVLGTALGLIGMLFREISNGVGPGFWILFQLGFVLGFGGAIILYLRFAGFEDVQEGGRAFLASVGIAMGAAVVYRIFLPAFDGHPDLYRVFLGGVAVVAIMAITNIFLKDDYLHVVKWGAMLAGAALIGLLLVNVTDGAGFDISGLNPLSWGKPAADDHTPKVIRLNPVSPQGMFSNISWPLSNVFEVSSGAKGLRWKLEEGSSCGTVIINDRHRVRQCPEEPEIPDLRKAGVLGQYENMHTVQFEGVGMKGMAYIPE